MDELLKALKENQLAVLLIVYLLGGGTLWPLVKKIAARTPTKVDDTVCELLDKLVVTRQAEWEQIAAAELEARLTDRQVIDIARLRKARWAAAKKKAASGGV